MKRSGLALISLFVPALAVAQPPPPPPGPGYYGPPPAGQEAPNFRQGLTFEANLGIGFMWVDNGTDESDKEVALGGLNLGIGGWLNPKMALSLRAAGTTYTDSEGAPVNAVMRILRDEFVYLPAWAFIFEDTWRARVKRHKADKNLSTRLLVNRSAEERRHARYYATRRNTERRYLAKPVERFGLYIVGDTAAILSLDASHLIGVRIVNRHIARNFERLFDALWDR